MISEFQGEYRFLSNFWPCVIELDIEGKHYIFPSSEHAYQASKFLDPKLHEYFADASLPSGAAKMFTTSISIIGIMVLSFGLFLLFLPFFCD